MEIQTDGGKLDLPDGTTAIFVDPSGKSLGVFNVAAGVWTDLMTQPVGGLDPTREEHSEVELKLAYVPPSTGRLRLQGVNTMRICRDKFGNPVTCPPR